MSMMNKWESFVKFLDDRIFWFVCVIWELIRIFYCWVIRLIEIGNENNSRKIMCFGVR